MKNQNPKTNGRHHRGKNQPLKPSTAAVKLLVHVEAGPEASPTDKSKAGYWAELINGHLRRSAAGLIEAGKHLLAAKQQLEHGEWQRMFETKLVYIHLREAQRLMQISRNTALSNTNSCSLLPPSSQALSALSKADPNALERALSSGQISARTTISEAKSFLRKHPAPGAKLPRSQPLKEFEMGKSLDRCRTVLYEEFNQCPEAELASFADELQVIVKSIVEALHDVQPSYRSALVGSSQQAAINPGEAASQ